MLRAELEAAHAYAAAHMPPQPAGVFSSNVPLLRVENNVGGTQVCMRLPRALQQRLFVLKCKRFNGASACLGAGDPDDPAVRATALIFAPGSVQIVGAPSVHVLRLLLHKICDVLRGAGHRPHMLFVSIDNRVATGGLGFPVALERMHHCMEGFVTTYEPRLFPGMICMHQAHGEQIVMTLFEGGNVTALGIKSLRRTSELFLSVYAMACAHRTAASVNHQKRKSGERRARLASEDMACEVDAARSEGKRRASKLIVAEMRAFVAANAARMLDPGFSRQMQQHVDAIVSRVVAKEDARAKRRRVRIAEPDGY